MDAFSIPVLVWVTLVVLLAGFVQGIIGFGFPLVAMPLLAPVIGLKAALLLTVFPSTILIMLATFSGGNLRESVRRFWFLPIVTLTAAYFGTRYMIVADPRPFVLVLALALLLYLNMERLGKAEAPIVQRYPATFTVIAGVTAGLFEAVVNVAAPPLLIFFMLIKLDPRALVQTMNFAWLGGKIVQFLTWTIVGGVTMAYWTSMVPWTIAALVTYFLGLRIRTRLPQAVYMVWLRRFLWVMSFVLLGQFVVSMG
jgi:uncharacterized protein